MCGIIGVISHSDNSDDRWNHAKAAQAHRGPDGQGEWRGRINKWFIDLAHQRLAILDLSAKGAQPMIHPKTGSLLVFNGEIYNYVELRAELIREGISFEGDSDSEVLLRGLEQWGIAKTLPKLNGMWAFAWLDQSTMQLYLSRDRCGEKPLYISVKNNSLVFSSELKTMLTLLSGRQPLNMQAIGMFLQFGIIDTTKESFISGIDQVTSGSYVTIDLNSDIISPKSSMYWHCPVVADNILPWHDFVETLRHQFLESVRIRLRSDVPVGILLSGGLDSSSIAGAAKSLNAHQLQLLSAVSDDKRFDESPFIDLMTQHLDWPVTKITLPSSPDALFRHIERTTWHNDAPIGGLSNIAHFLLLESAKEQNITVVLSGQGADELLCGYRKFLGFYIEYLVRRGDVITALNVLTEFWRNGSILSQFSLLDAKRYLPAVIRGNQRSVYGPSLTGLTTTSIGIRRGSTLNERQLEDVLYYSVPTLNHYEDRLSMAWSREIRLPFLDPSLIELLIPAPAHYKLQRGWTKYAMRCAVEPFLPHDITWRKDKQGFINPESEWVKHRLRQHIIDTYFNEDSYIFQWGLLKRKSLLETYNIYCRQSVGSGSVSFGEIFWPLALEVWLRVFNDYIQKPN
jgi:asparagine synthase (glutamine-hydrolysing)